VRIVYLSPFPADLVTGGIKVMHRHVEMLQGMGFDASIFSPQGYPRWMNSLAKLFAGTDPAKDPDNLLVFPETLMGPLGEAARTPTPAAKALLCQNQYNAFSETIPRHTFAELGFVKLLTVGELAKGFLERILAPAQFEVVPVWVDHGIFLPRGKSMRIAVMPRKLPKHYALIRQIFVLKYPQYSGVPWDLIDSASEQETAQILGRAAVFLSMCDRECVPLTPLEAMAAECVVVGFHGYGGLEYATDANGLWLRPDYLEETADALAQAVAGIETDAPSSRSMRTAGAATARLFNRARTETALRAAFDPLCR
jgi:glycosyltransferase involved in cell wall biosynthesis